MKMNRILTSIVLSAGLAASLSAQDLVKHLNMEEATKAATSRVQPEYPAMGKQLKLEGMVQVEASIDERGAVESVRVMSGNVVLANSAVNAVKRWKFSPLTMEGKPAKGSAVLSFTFKL